MDDCARMNCDREAVALLSFSPQDAKAWLSDLIEPDATGGIILCRLHANATVVPMSWQLVDGRDPAWPGRDLDVAEVPAVTPIELDQPVIEMPSDAAQLDDEFAAIHADLPIQPKRYGDAPVVIAEPGRPAADDLVIDVEGADVDPALFQLSIGDLPAVGAPGTR